MKGSSFQKKWRNLLLLAAVQFFFSQTPVLALEKGSSFADTYLSKTGRFLEESAEGFLNAWCSDQKELRIREDNDLFKPNSTDRFYTQGLSLDLKLLGKAGKDKRNYGVVLGQEIYTPSDIKSKNVALYERPYAGWLYTGVYREDITADETYAKYEIDVGVIGPASLAGETQKRWHKLIKSPDPQGWDSEVGNEVGLVLHYEYVPVVKSFITWSNNNRAIDVAPIFKVNAGNIFDNVSVGTIARIGDLRSYDTSRNHIISTYYDLREKHRPFEMLEWFFFFRADAKYVLYNALLEGGLINKVFKGSENIPHSVSARPLVLSGDMGVSFHWKYLSLSYTFFGFISPETNSGKGNIADVETQKFGRIELVFRW